MSVNRHTLADFRTGHVVWLDGLLTHAVAVPCEQDLVALNRVARDGVRVRTCAGAASFHRKATLEEAREQVARLKEEMDDDPSDPSRRHAPAGERAARERAPSERAPRERQQRLGQAPARLSGFEAKRKPDEKEKAQASSTDPEATVMKMADGGFRPASNGHYAADCATLVIVGVEVIPTGRDMG